MTHGKVFSVRLFIMENEPGYYYLIFFHLKGVKYLGLLMNNNNTFRSVFRIGLSGAMTRFFNMFTADL